MQLIEYKITNAPHVSAHKQMKPPPNCSLFIDSVAFFPSTVAHFGDGSSFDESVARLFSFERLMLHLFSLGDNSNHIERARAWTPLNLHVVNAF